MRLANGAVCHALSVDDFHKLGEVGVLRDDDRVELIEGALIDMSWLLSAAEMPVW